MRGLVNSRLLIFSRKNYNVYNRKLLIIYIYY